MKILVFSLGLLVAASLSAQSVQTFALKEILTKPINELLTKGI